MKKMEYEGYKLKLVGGDCYGCFFADKVGCPDCGNGKWIIDGNAWHTGRPTEEGLYAVYYWDDHNPNGTSYPTLYDGFVSPNFNDEFIKWINSDGEVEFYEEDIVRWQRITPYEEASE